MQWVKARADDTKIDFGDEKKQHARLKIAMASTNYDTSRAIFVALSSCELKFWIIPHMHSACAILAAIQLHASLQALHVRLQPLPSLVGLLHLEAGDLVALLLHSAMRLLGKHRAVFQVQWRLLRSALVGR